jgi:hypothetical protein
MTDKNIFSVNKGASLRPSGDLNVSRISEIPRSGDRDDRILGIDDRLPDSHVPNFYAPETSTVDNEPDDEFANEPTILEELDIDMEAVKSKLKSTLFFFKPDPEFAKKPDLTGPLILATILGVILTLVVSSERTRQLRIHLRSRLLRLSADLLPPQHDETR